MNYSRCRMNQYQKSRRLKAASKGLCVICAKRPVTEGCRTCDVCRGRCRESRALVRAEGLPPKPITCPICGSIPDRFYWHHWEDFHYELGMWICPYCNIIVELEDRGLVDKYRKLKDDATYEYNKSVLRETLNLRYLT